MGRTLLWRLPDPKPREFAGFNFEYTPVALSPNGKTLVAPVVWGISFQEWDTASGQPRFDLGTGKGAPDLVAFSVDGHWLVAAQRGDRFRLYREDSPAPWRTFEMHQAGTYAVAFSPNGRTLFSAGRDSVITLREIETGKVRRTLAGHRGPVLALAISPDGKQLASGGEDGQVLLHALVLPRKSDEAWNDDRLWRMLGDRDAATADRAAATLHGSPREALSLLASRLKAAPPLPSTRTGKLIGDLEHRRYLVRSEASTLLERLGPSATASIRRALRDGPSLEVRRRLEEIVKRIEETPLSQDELRAVRAVEVLEQMGTAEARAILRRLAEGAAGDHQTEAARSALNRLVS